jgi:bifunctional DNA-binding transcriptional regulator/antitoxin component of YhaV-PrlF toxin-antitoxin module
MLFMTQTKISKAFQTTISAEAIRALGLQPGQRVNQIVEGKRLVLEVVEDADALAGSLGKGKRAHAVDEIKAAGRTAMAKAGAAGLEKGR